MSRTPEYHIWRSMLARCFNPKHKAYEDYGGRGITVCDRWRNSFVDFISDIGMRPAATASVGRINNDKIYEPGNVRWESRFEQMRNTRFNRIVTIEGISKTVAEWVELSNGNLSRKGFHRRLCRGICGVSLLAPRSNSGKARPA